MDLFQQSLDILVGDHDADTDMEVFWHNFRLALLNGTPAQRDSIPFRQILNAATLNAAETRLLTMNEDEVNWLTKKLRRKDHPGDFKPIRLWRAAEEGNVTGFVWHTNREHAFNDLNSTNPQKAVLVEAVINPVNVLYRLQESGNKIVISFPERIKPMAVMDLTRNEVLEQQQPDGSWQKIA